MEEQKEGIASRKQRVETCSRSGQMSSLSAAVLFGSGGVTSAASRGWASHVLCVGIRQHQKVTKKPGESVALRQDRRRVHSLKKSLIGREGAGELYVAGQSRRKQGNITLGHTVRPVTSAAWQNSYRLRAGSRVLLRSLAIYRAVLTTSLFASLLVNPTAPLRIRNGPGGDSPKGGSVLVLFPRDKTVFSHLKNAGVSSESRAEHADFASYRAETSATGSVLFPPPRGPPDSSAGTWSFSETENYSGAIGSRPNDVPPHRWRQAVQVSQVEHHGAGFSAIQHSLSARADGSEFGQPRKEQWLCRISVDWGACGWRQEGRRGPDWHCPPVHCCSKSACSRGKCLGGWCVGHGSALCWIKDYRYDENTCSCQHFGHRCSGNAVCHTINADDGGTYCTCGRNFLGNGLTCTSNPCQSNPCSPGTCSPRGDSYVCDCPVNTHEVSASSRPTCVAKKNPCMTDPCGATAVVHQCVNFETGYECICREGYISERGICEKVDWCKNDPCGPPAAVHECVSVGVGFTCSCQRGYMRVFDDEGLQYCEKDFCADNPCGAPELVKSCKSRVGHRREPTETNSSSENSPRYSCLCTNDAELKVDPGTGEGQCVRLDPCKNNPCGPPEAVAQCFVEGRSYGCTCKAGYTVQPSGGDGGQKCVAGDPCDLKACGPDEFVANCRTDGKTYTCTCNESGFLSLEANGMQLCRSKQLCEENCGPANAVKQCTPRADTYDCVCKPGFLLTYNGGKRSCVPGDPCAVAPCGGPKAVAECRKEEYGYSCICNRNYELRSRPDDTQLCAEPQSCVGDPCGPVEAVELCLPGNHTYTCKCREPYVLQVVRGRQRCALSSSGGEVETSKPLSTEKTDKRETEGPSTGLLAGVALGGVALVGAAYVGISHARKQPAGEMSDRVGVGENYTAGGSAEALTEPLPSPAVAEDNVGGNVPVSSSSWR